MPKPASRATLALALALAAASPAAAQSIRALPDQTSRVRVSNHDINHIVCEGGDIDDVKFSAEKGITVEKGGSDAWVKFLVKETDDAGQVTRSYVTAPSEFFVSCNGANYPLYAEPADVPAQTVVLVAGSAQRARANTDLLGPLVEEERAVSITLAILDDRVPASFAEVAPAAGTIQLAGLPAATLVEHRRLDVEGSGLTGSEYLVRATGPVTLDERSFLDPALGAGIFAVTFDRAQLAAGDTARLVVIRRGAVQ
ncbi:type-F conjugative transfer system secretin TraK [Sphingomonas sp. H39-1-10]|uniref:type-F conjugative transfer system secretin TraK n=1 Tax=Sphingomonas pollutisoli TaxID=3030829 RepID=UPI0023B8BC67|nr:type-F conjugative transfer system secretin TraK [Sphingomonas pollutisoli]MDF0487722.1 type-F conjugative transfer system secretin TraK [Sphingomonas pollutisoli]